MSVHSGESAKCSYFAVEKNSQVDLKVKAVANGGTVVHCVTLETKVWYNWSTTEYPYPHSRLEMLLKA